MDQRIQSKFLESVNIIQSRLTFIAPSDTLSNDEKLRFYGLYKQATTGPCSGATKPAFWDVVARAKWDSWNSLGDMTQEEAMLEYADELLDYLKRMSLKYPRALEFIDLLQSVAETGNSVHSLHSNNNDADVDESNLQRSGSKSSSNHSLVTDRERFHSISSAASPQISSSLPDLEDRVKFLELCLKLVEDRISTLEKYKRDKSRRIAVSAVGVFVMIMLFRRDGILSSMKKKLFG